jgi:N utilization substance protein B
MGRRHRAREIALKLLYQVDVGGVPPEEALTGYLERRKLPPDVVAFAEGLVRGVARERPDLDRRIGAAAEGWKVERMPAVDRNLLRMAVFELVRGADAPPAVVIDEALELAKRYCDAESGPFINGVLDHIRRDLAAGQG